MSPKSLVDVLIIGAGPAGVSCAAALARLRHTAIDHQDPSEFRAASREDILTRHKTIRFGDVGIQAIEKVSKDGDGEGSSIFEGADNSGRDSWGRKLVLATGLVKHGDRALVKDIGDAKVTSNPDVNSKCRSKIEAHHYSIQDFIVNDDLSSGLTIVFNKDDGEELGDPAHAFLVHKPVTEQTNDLAHQLGIKVTEQGDIKVTYPFNQTTVRGAFATGDCASTLKNFVGAMYVGTCVGASVGSQIQGED